MKKTCILLLLAAICLASCSREPVPATPQEILLQADVEELEVATKTPYTTTTITSVNTLDADVWLSTTSGTYPNSSDDGEGDNTIAYHNTASFVSNNAQGMEHAIYYPADPNTTPVYICGFYPQSTWSLSGGNTTAACTFDGKTDIMFAPEVSTTLAATTAAAGGVGSYPRLTFAHLLTWLRIKVKTSDANMVNAWGTLQSIQLKSAQNSVSMLLSGSTPVFSGSTSMSTYGTGGNTPYTGQSYRLTTSAVEQAYVLCAPVTATNSADEYTLIVTTANRSSLEVPINLKASGDSGDFVGSTAGHEFIVTLEFGQGAVTTSVAAVTGWDNGGLASGDLTE